MRRTFLFFMLVALMLTGLLLPAGTARAQGTPSFDVAGTDAQKVTAFLKQLQAAVAFDNRIKVASLFDFPLKVWIGGQDVTIRNESEFHTRYSQIFDAGLKQSIAAAKVETLVANQQGVMFDNGRVWFRPTVEHKNAIKVVAINEPGPR
jgi:hypothetical protein